METISRIIQALLPNEEFDALAVGVVDFKQDKFKFIEASQDDEQLLIQEERTYYYDLASLTKPLTNSLSFFLNPSAFDEKMLLCLNHRGGLPAWGLLPQLGWKEMIKAYTIRESLTLYSDFSALRVMLELGQKSISQKQLCQQVWDEEVLNWLDLPEQAPTLQYGFKRGEPNFGEVHDPNAWVIREFCSHAGLFGTITGVLRTLLNYQKQTDFISQVASDLKKHDHRFSFGWDRVQNPLESLSGVGCGKNTFGHLGFTGTSIWIDPDRMLGHVILSNATKKYWYQKQGLNDLRRAIGEIVWSEGL
jgi:CubicO group peptidase (beta-lactamase class C family)